MKPSHIGTAFVFADFTKLIIIPQPNSSQFILFKETKKKVKFNNGPMGFCWDNSFNREPENPVTSPPPTVTVTKKNNCLPNAPATCIETVQKCHHVSTF